jgi:hypothetical protein
MRLFAYVAKVVEAFQALGMSHHIFAWVSARLAASTLVSFVGLLFQGHIRRVNPLAAGLAVLRHRLIEVLARGRRGLGSSLLS